MLGRVEFSFTRWSGMFHLMLSAGGGVVEQGTARLFAGAMRKQLERSVHCSKCRVKVASMSK